MFQLSIEGTDTDIDALCQGTDAQFFHHSCEPSARYVTIGVDGIEYDVFLEALVEMPAGTEVFDNYGRSIADPATLVICVCDKLSWKDYTWIL